MATLVALMAAPVLNRDTPWFDYETWAQETSASKSTSFTWNHSYGALNWPRDGRELLRVRARPAGLLEGREPRRLRRHGVATIGVAPASVDGVRRVDRPPRSYERWTQKIKVSIRNLRTDQFITAGDARELEIPKLAAHPDARRSLRGSRARCGAATPTRRRVYTPKPEA